MKKFEMPELQVIVFEEEPVMASGLYVATDPTEAQYGSDSTFTPTGSFK